jgi:hypothetical protein
MKIPARLYERVVLTKPVVLDFVGDIMAIGRDAIVVDFVDENEVILEFAFAAPELEGGQRFETATASCDDFRPMG